LWKNGGFSKYHGFSIDSGTLTTNFTNTGTEIARGTRMAVQEIFAERGLTVELMPDGRSGAGLVKN
jgi:hypothetical protein